MRRLYTLLSVTLASVTLLAQTSNLQVGNWQVLKALQPGQKIRVSLRAGGSFDGGLQQVNDGTLTMSNGQTVNEEDVQRVWVRRASHRGRHSLTGAAIGATVGFGIGAGIDNDCSKNSIVCTGNRGKAIGGPLFGALGAGIGAMLPAHEWEEVYRKK
jgi:hypothetical protein